MLKKSAILLIMLSIALFTGCGNMTFDVNGDGISDIDLTGFLSGTEGVWDQAKWDQSKWAR